MESFVKPDKVYTVSEVTRLVKTELENAFPMLWVEGEISNFHRHHSGHLYFTLKDEMSQLRTVMFRSDAKRVPFELKDGLQVVARGRINVYEPRGEYQLAVELLEPKGKGALQLAFEQLKEKLKTEGLFDPARKKKLPLLPKKVGVVTSPRGAAIVDIIRTLERRFARLHILLYPVKVQGKGAAEEIVEGIDYLGQLPGIDVMIVGRGGGSIEDLWAFNEEKVARAIFRCPIPVISAVGHEIDFTIADFVADIRASTPSVAAEIVIKEEESLRERIENLEKRLVHNQKYYLQEQRHEVLSLTQHRAFQNMKITLLNLAQKVDELDMRAWNAIRNRQQKISEDKFRTELLEEKIRSALKEMLQQFQARWETLSAQLHNLSPLNILKKGYALCWKDGGQYLVRRIEEVEKEKEMTVSFFKGEFTCLVKDVDKTKRIESRSNNSSEK
ncbi:MAG: exodeoxyribonuclease VII large subunit [Candidatus Aminicenantes bacterium]|nr:MAG: exodeoxyribonuclease VII large subunit [Candidatus Aminicenantes bacterium]